MKAADDEVTQSMDELSEHFNDGLSIIEGAARPFEHGVADDVLQIEEGGGEGEDDRKEVVLGTVMADLEELMNEKAARLEELDREHDRVQRQIVQLAIAILGKENVSFAQDENKDLNKRAICVGLEDVRDAFKETDAAETHYEDLEQVYQDAKNGLDDLQKKLDDLASRSLDENKEGLKVRVSSQSIWCTPLTEPAGFSNESKVETRRAQ